jgi:hypothetical protein
VHEGEAVVCAIVIAGFSANNAYGSRRQHRYRNRRSLSECSMDNSTYFILYGVIHIHHFALPKPL